MQTGCAIAWERYRLDTEVELPRVRARFTYISACVIGQTDPPSLHLQSSMNIDSNESSKEPLRIRLRRPFWSHINPVTTIRQATKRKMHYM